MDNMMIDIEILQSRVSSMQAAIISMGNPKTAELRHEVAQLRVELEEEKVKNVSLDLQVKSLKDEIAKIKPSFQTTFVKTVDAFVSVDTTQFELISEDSDMNSSGSIEITPVVGDKTSRTDNSQRINPGAFNEQLNHYRSKHTKQYLKHKIRDPHKVSKLVNEAKFTDDSRSSLNKQINSYIEQNKKKIQIGQQL